MRGRALRISCRSTLFEVRPLRKRYKPTIPSFHSPETVSMADSPFLFRRLVFAHLDRRSLTISERPMKAATCKGVFPSRFLPVGLAPFWRRNRACSSRP